MKKAFAHPTPSELASVVSEFFSYPLRFSLLLVFSRPLFDLI